ncbi:MAG: hypothetical protein GX493_08930 [Firmicutes bacterium]|nr:hypothetical protein [Bacillota bacterium]
MPSLSEALKETVLAAGIDLVGITSAEPLPAHRAGYPHRQPREVLAGARRGGGRFLRGLRAAARPFGARQAPRPVHAVRQQGL